MASNVIKANDSTKCDNVTPVKKSNITLTDEDRFAFEALRIKIKTTGIENLELGPSPMGMIIVPTPNTGRNANFADGGGDQAKANVVSALSQGLTKLRTRPGMAKDATIAKVSKNESLDENANKNATLVGSNLPQHVETAPGIKKEVKFTPCVAKGWKTNVVRDNGVESVHSKKPVGKLNDIFDVNIKEQVKDVPDNKIPGFQSTHDNKIPGFQSTHDNKIPGFQSTHDSKIPGFQPVSSKIVHQNSNNYSLSSSFNNVSPKGFELSHSSPVGETSKGKQEDKTNVNKNVHKCENNNKGNVFIGECNDNKLETRNNVYSLDELDADSNKTNILHSTHDLIMDLKAMESSNILHSLDECNTDTKLKLSIIQQKALGHKEPLLTSNTGNASSALEHGKKPHEAGSDFAWIGKCKEETSKKSTPLDMGHTTQPLFRATISDSKPYISASSSSGIKSHIDKFDLTKPALEAEESNEKSLTASSNDQEFRHKMFTGPSKPSIEKFKFHKKEFENNAAQQTLQSSPTKNVGKGDMFGKDVIEKKQSFESMDIQKQKFQEKEEIICIEKTVIDSINKLNEPETTAKTEQIISCCSQSLPSSLKDESLKDDHASLSSSSLKENHVSLPLSIQKDSHVSLSSPTQKDNQVTLPSSSQKNDHVPLPSSTQKDNQMTLPSSIQKDNQVTLPSSIQKDNHVPLLSSNQKDNQVTLPSSIQKDNHVPLLSSTQKDNQVTLLSSTQKDNQVTLPSSIQKDNHVPLLSSNQKDNQVTLPSSIQKDNHVPLLSSTQKDNQVTVLSSTQKDNQVTPPSSIQKDNHVPLLSSTQKDNQVTLPSSIQKDNHVPLLSSTQKDNQVTLPSSIQKDNQVPLLSSTQKDIQVALPSSIQKDNHVPLLSSNQKDNQVTLPSSIQKDNHVPLLSSTQKDIQVALPSSIQKDDLLTLPSSNQKVDLGTLPSSIQKDNQVPLLSSTQKDIQGALPSSIQKDNQVTLPSSIQKDNHVPLLSSNQRDNQVTLPSSIQKDNHVQFLSSTQKDIQVALPSSIQKDDLLTLPSSNQKVDLGTLPSSIQKDELMSKQAKEDPQELSETNLGSIYLESFNVRIPDEVSDYNANSEVDLIYDVVPGQEEKDGVVYRKTFNDRVSVVKKSRKTEEQTKDAVFQPGPGVDIDNNHHSSNSAIYDHVDQKFTRRAALIESANFDDRAMLDLPTLRETKDKETEDRFRSPYKGKTADAETDLKPGTGMDVLSQSEMLSKTKILKRSKSGSGTNLDAADMDYKQNSRKSSFDNSDEESSKVQKKIIAPPLPPRDSELYIDMSYILSPKDVINLSSRNLDSRSDRSSPLPLPTCHQISRSLDLNTVVPLPPSGDKNSATSDSYLHGQLLNVSPATNVTTSPHNFTSPNDAPTYPQRPPLGRRTSNPSADSYIDVGEMNELMKSIGLHADSYVDVGDSSLPDAEYSLPGEIEIRKELEIRPVSSAYIKHEDIATIPTAGSSRLGRAPFEDVLSFYSPFEQDCLYIDLSDDQVYGTGRRYTSKLESSSLYQFYNKDTISRASQRKAVYSNIEVFDEDDDDLYVEEERIYEDMSACGDFGRNSLDIEEVAEAGTTVKLSTLDIFGKPGTLMRALWSEMPEVKKSGVLDNITPHERKLQESMFEIITSEATYLKSLNVLIDVFLLSDELGCKLLPKCVITKQQQHVIFSNIGLIRDTSERFLSKLESRWQEAVVLSDVCDIITEHSMKYFECYIHYCSNQAFQERAVTDLKKKPDFAEALRRLEARPECQGLPMISFLLLPMQRITRLPLLVDAICHRLVPEKDEKRHKSALNAFHCLSKVVRRCNDGVKKMQQTEQMYFISTQIEFSANKAIANIPLLSASRYLVKQGELFRITNETGSRIPFGKAKHGKKVVHMFLFNDLLVITKKKGEKYVVCDHAQRNSLHAEELNSPEMCAKYLPLGVPGSCKYLFLLVMLENHEKKQVEAVFSCNSVSDRTRWVDIVTPFKVMDQQRIYEEWDCPQVQCIKKYVACEPDELTLEESDVVNVYKKLEDDGMYEGERLRDGERGWFPKDHTLEIQNSHVRARNMRMKYRLQAAAESGSKTSN